MKPLKDALLDLFIDAEPEDGSIQTEVVEGLLRRPRTLPPKLFYDAVGSRLFDAICELEEYYPTRTETDIMRASVGPMASMIGPAAVLVEYGSGSSIKTEILIQALDSPAAYIPIDISRSHLLESAARVQDRHPDLRVLPVCADYTRDIPELTAFARKQKTVVYFPGSTIGNFEPEKAQAFLRHVGHLVGKGGGLLIGVDLKKDPRRLQAAYDDASGVTAEFNLNMLRHINNRLARPAFDLAAFRHRAVWNEEASRIEMHLVAQREQLVSVDGVEFVFSPGEHIVTEHSYKYSLAGFRKLAAGAGFSSDQVWTDAEQLFSVHYLTATG